MVGIPVEAKDPDFGKIAPIISVLIPIPTIGLGIIFLVRRSSLYSTKPC